MTVRRTDNTGMFLRRLRDEGRKAPVGESPIYLTNQYSKEFKIIEFVGSGKTVLEVGCYNGHMSLYFVANNCIVTGVEINSRLGQEAAKYCSRVVIGDIEKTETQAQIEGKYAIIVMADLLEHLVDPWKTLRVMKRFIQPNGFIVIALPNIAYFRMRLNLLLGRFNYLPKGGILESTHLRFFTLKTAKKMIEEAGYTIIRFYPAPSLARGERLAKLPLLGRSSVVWNGTLPAFAARLMPTLFGLSLLFVVSPTREASD